MRTTPFAALALSLTLGAPASGRAQTIDPPPITCPKPVAGLTGPFAPTQEAAEAIYRAYALAAWPDLLKKYPIIKSEDAGDHWSVTQTRDEKIHAIQQSRQVVVGSDGKPYTVTSNHVDANGGELRLDIDKCTAAISHVAFGD